MNKLFEDFPNTPKAEWIALLEKELKGESLDVLQKIDPIEEIAYPSYFHREDAVSAYSDPGKSPFTRGYGEKDNNWKITSIFRVENEQNSNKEILNALMAGTEHVVLNPVSAQINAFDTLLHEVDLSVCPVTLISDSKEQVAAFLNYTKGKNARVVYPNPADLFELLAQTSDSTRLFTIDAYRVQQAGGTTWQEVSIALAEAHEVFVQLLDQGLEANKAASLIQFHVGIGSTYFFELAKIRALRTLWSLILSNYEVSPKTIEETPIVGKTGFVNISLKDPYTNLLRQTTEALSATIGGVSDLLIQPYDWFSTEQNTTFTRRMATNISLLLKEESYLNLVIDPAGGSYALDILTETILERAWIQFQEIEAKGTIRNPALKQELAEAIQEKATRRTAAVNDKSTKRIGINIFPNPDKTTGEWKTLPAAWNNLPTLNLEQVYEQA